MLIPAIAAVTAFASVATLIVAVVIATVLGALSGPDVVTGRGLLAVISIGTYVVGIGAAIVRGRAPRPAADPGAQARDHPAGHHPAGQT